MTKYGSPDVAFFLIDGLSILGTMTEFDDKGTLHTEETTVLGSGWEEHYLTGLREVAISQKGFYDDASGSSNQTLVALSGSVRLLCFGLAGNTIGRAYRGIGGLLQATYNRLPKRNELHKAEADYKISGTVRDGKILHALGAKTAAGNTDASSVDNGASSASGGYMDLHVTALTLGGYDNVVVTLRHSSDNVTFANKQAATAVTSAPAAEQVSVSGTINRYTSVAYAFTGSGSSPSVTFMAGLTRQ